MQVRMSEGGSFAIHKIRHGDQFYSAYFNADGTMADLEHTGRWGQAGGFRINRECSFETSRSVPLRHTNVRIAIQAIGRRVKAERDNLADKLNNALSGDQP